MIVVAEVVVVIVVIIAFYRGGRHQTAERGRLFDDVVVLLAVQRATVAQSELITYAGESMLC